MKLITRQQAPEILGVSKSRFGNIWDTGAAYGRPAIRERKRKTAYYCQQDMIDWHERYKARPTRQPYVERFNPHFDNAEALEFIIAKPIEGEVTMASIAARHTRKFGGTTTVKCRALDEYTPNATLPTTPQHHYFGAY